MSERVLITSIVAGAVVVVASIIGNYMQNKAKIEVEQTRVVQEAKTERSEEHWGWINKLPFLKDE